MKEYLPNKKAKSRFIMVNDFNEIWSIACSNNSIAAFDTVDHFRACGQHVCPLMKISKSYFAGHLAAGIMVDFKYKRSFDIGLGNIFRLQVFQNLSKSFYKFELKISE